MSFGASFPDVTAEPVSRLYTETMCGRFTYLTYEELEEVVQAIGRRETVRLRPGSERAQARPGSEVSIIAPNDGELAIAPLVWGFESGGKLVFNARIESALAGSPLWASSFREGRCIVPVATFFEPHARETARNPRTGRASKRQYEFASPVSEPLLLAGLQTDGRFSVVTTEPNRWVSPIHARMPLALRFEEVGLWLDGDVERLADRSLFELAVAPEDGAPAAADAQMSLF